jgi:hypothetical protein
VLTPFPPVSDPERISLLAGSTVTGGYGLLIGNALTGQVEMWLLPQGLEPAGVSPSGRYFAFGRTLYDAWTGAATDLVLEGLIAAASYSPDESMVYVQTATGGRIVELDGSEVARLPDLAAPPAAPGHGLLDVVWSADSRGLAVTRTDGRARRIDVVVDRGRRDIPSSGMAAWSRNGLRLAVTGERPAIYDFETGAIVELERGGTFPAWSGDDRYLAVDIGADGTAGLGLLDTQTGTEVMRLYNRSACFLIYWYEGPALAGVSDTGAIRVPDGEVIPYEPRPRGQFAEVGMDGMMMQWRDAAGTVYAEIRVDAMWAFSFAWVRRDIEVGFPPVVFLGRGGQDACGGQSELAVVAKPPFTADQVPTPTPTPDK